MPCVGVRLPGCVLCHAVPRAADLTHTGVSGWYPGGLRGESDVIPTFSPSDDPPLDATSVGRGRGMLVLFRPFGNFAGFVMVSVVE